MENQCPLNFITLFQKSFQMFMNVFCINIVIIKPVQITNPLLCSMGHWFSYILIFCEYNILHIVLMISYLSNKVWWSKIYIGIALKERALWKWYLNWNTYNSVRNVITFETEKLQVFHALINSYSTFPNFLQLLSIFSLAFSKICNIFLWLQIGFRRFKVCSFLCKTLLLTSYK